MVRDTPPPPHPHSWDEKSMCPPQESRGRAPPRRSKIRRPGRPHSRDETRSRRPIRAGGSSRKTVPSMRPRYSCNRARSRSDLQNYDSAACRTRSYQDANTKKNAYLSTSEHTYPFARRKWRRGCFPSSLSWKAWRQPSSCTFPLEKR